MRGIRFAKNAMACGAALAALGTLAAFLFWPRVDPQTLVHRHPELAPDHPHLAGSAEHEHDFVIDDLHERWPRPGA